MTTCYVCHREPALNHFWIDGELGYQPVCHDCQTPAQRVIADTPRPAV